MNELNKKKYTQTTTHYVSIHQMLKFKFTVRLTYLKKYILVTFETPKLLEIFLFMVFTWKSFDSGIYIKKSCILIQQQISNYKQILYFQNIPFNLIQIITELESGPYQLQRLINDYYNDILFTLLLLEKRLNTISTFPSFVSLTFMNFKRRPGTLCQPLVLCDSIHKLAKQNMPPSIFFIN